MATNKALSARELEVSGLAWLCVGDDFPKIDFDKLAKLASIPTAKTTSNQWGVIKSKIKAAAANDSTSTDLTPREFELAGLAWQCVASGKISRVDGAKLRKLAKFNTLKTTTNTWWAIKKKLAAKTEGANGDTTADGSATPTKPSRGTKTATGSTKRKAAAAASGEPGVDGTPTKRVRQRKGPKAEEPEAEAVANEQKEV